MKLGLRLSRSLGTVGAALLFARASSAQSRACRPTGADSIPSSARWPAPLDRLVTVRATGLSLRDALDRVAAIAKLRLSYSSEGLPLDRAVCLSADGDPAGKVLAELTAGTNVVAVPAGGDQVALTPRQQPAPAAQPQQPPDMAPSVGVLDRVVVTGSAVPAPERELTVGINVLTGRQLARENTNSLSSALDNYVPGMWSWQQSPVSVLSSYASIRGASSFGLSYPKVYIDGIEVANPLLVSRFAPEAIDHVEVIRGPQGSALYGTDAISGVVNIVSRHDGASREGDRGSVRSSAGFTQSAFSRNALSQQHDVSFLAGSSTRSADLHVSGGTTGAFIPKAYSRDLLANSSARFVGENSTLTATARFFAQEAGSTTSPLLTPASTAPSGFSQQSTAPQSVREYTVGTNATYSPSELWTHSIVAGVDGYRLANVESSFTPVPRGADSALRAAQGRADRATIRATSILNLRSMEPTRLTLTVSAEHSALREVTQVQAAEMSSPPPVQTRRSVYGIGTIPGESDGLTRPVTEQITGWQSSTGVTGSATAALDNTVFFTGGLRVERDSRLPKDDDVALLPMLGLASVHDFGPATIKLRAAYGQGIRPPSTVAHAAFWQTNATAATQGSLGAERQSGIETGIDFMFAHAFSLKVTHFDQNASGLIQQVVVPATTDEKSPRWAFKLENVGEIANRGWEFEAQTAVSRLSITGTMSFVDSRVQHLAEGYTGDLLTGDRMLQVPARTGSLNLSWLGRRWYASVSGSRAFDWINYDELALSQMFNGTRPAGEISGARLRRYWRDYTGSLHVRATASRDVFDRFAVELTGENLLGHQLNEPDNMTVLPGRTVMTAVRLKF